MNNSDKKVCKKVENTSLIDYQTKMKKLEKRYKIIAISIIIIVLLAVGFVLIY